MQVARTGARERKRAAHCADCGKMRTRLQGGTLGAQRAGHAQAVTSRRFQCTPVERMQVKDVASKEVGSSATCWSGAGSSGVSLCLRFLSRLRIAHAGLASLAVNSASGGPELVRMPLTKPNRVLEVLARGRTKLWRGCPKDARLEHRSERKMMWQTPSCHVAARVVANTSRPPRQDPHRRRQVSPIFEP